MDKTVEEIALRLATIKTIQNTAKKHGVWCERYEMICIDAKWCKEPCCVGEDDFLEEEE